MDRSAVKKFGRRKAGTWGRTHGPSRGNTKRAANKAVRREGRPIYHGLEFPRA